MKNLNSFSNYEVQLKKRLDEDEDDTDDEGSGRYLGYAVQSKTISRYTIPIDESIKEASYYRNVCNVISNANEGDYVEFQISSPGGYLNGLIALLTSMQKTDAVTVAHINGECHSAASLLALNCDSVHVAPYATMLVHFVRFGSQGKAWDVVQHVSHTYELSEQLFRDTYQDFLTEEEIVDCLRGKEMYMNSSEISVRLKRKFDALNEKHRKELDNCEECEIPEEKPKKTKKKTQKSEDSSE